MKFTLRPSGGHILDIDASEIAQQFLSVAHNVHTRKGFPSRIGGRRIIYPVNAGHAPNDPYHILNFFLNTNNWWALFGTDSIHAVEGGNTFDITPLAGLTSITNPFEWSSTLLNGIPVFTNGLDPLMFWDGSGSSDAATVTDWPVGQICKAVVAFRFHLFALNVENGSGTFENLIVWSDAAEPGTLPASWTPSASNEAGSAILADTPGRCVTGRPLGQQLMIYKPQSQYAVEYLGQQPDNIFTVRPVQRSTGALSTHCVTEIELAGPQHLVVGNDDIVLTNGVSTRSVAENRIKRFLANQVDPEFATNSFVIHDISKREVWVCVPETGSQFATVGHIWDMRRDTWVTRDLNNLRHAAIGFVQDEDVDNTWAAQVGTWANAQGKWAGENVNSNSRLVVAEPNDLYVEDTGDLVSIAGRIVKEDMTLGDGTMRMVTSRVWVGGTGVIAGMQVRLGARDSTDEDDPIAWGAFVDYSDDGMPYEVEGRYISFEAVQTGTDPWTVNRITIEAVESGPY